MRSPLLLALVSLSCVSCAQHRVTQPTGQVVESTTVLAKGGLTTTADGSIVMFTDADAATQAIANYARLAIWAGLARTGINAAKDLGETITQEVTK
jgi:hypothetical protein